MRDATGNLPPLPDIFPDQLAPIVRNAPDGVRELLLAQWGMPEPPQFGGAPVTNIRNTKSPHWRAWLNLLALANAPNPKAISMNDTVDINTFKSIVDNCPEEITPLKNDLRPDYE